MVMSHLGISKRCCTPWHKPPHVTRTQCGYAAFHSHPLQQAARVTGRDCDIQIMSHRRRDTTRVQQQMVRMSRYGLWPR